MSDGKCAFNRERLSDAKFSWVKEFKSDKHKAMCCVCIKVIDFERMGESALKSHMKGEKHKWNTSATSSSTHSLLMLQVVTKGRNLLPSCADASNHKKLVGCIWI